MEYYGISLPSDIAGFRALFASLPFWLSVLSILAVWAAIALSRFLAYRREFQTLVCI